jgi:hypothetical protein
MRKHRGREPPSATHRGGGGLTFVNSARSVVLLVPGWTFRAKRRQFSGYGADAEWDNGVVGGADGAELQALTQTVDLDGTDINEGMAEFPDETAFLTIPYLIFSGTFSQYTCSFFPCISSALIKFLIGSPI